MSKYSNEEKVMFSCAYFSGCSSREVVQHFAGMFPDRPVPAPTTVLRTVQKFQSTACLSEEHNKHKMRKYAMNDELKMSIVLRVEESRSISVRQLADEFQVSVGSVHKLLKQESYKSFKFGNHQELLPWDSGQRALFCETMIENINTDQRLINKICFTDESTFTLRHHVNNQNCRYWSRDNLHIFNQTHTQYRQSVNVWMGLLNGRLLGPFFIEGTLNGNKYLSLLQENIVPAINELQLNNVWYQHDGAPAHYTRGVQNVLNATFPRRWIGRGGYIHWPPRSPDLSPLDFSIWGLLKSKVYTPVPLNNVEELKDRIRLCSGQISAEALQNMTREFYDRLGYCLAQNGDHFEHLL